METLSGGLLLVLISIAAFLLLWLLIMWIVLPLYIIKIKNALDELVMITKRIYKG